MKREVSFNKSKLYAGVNKLSLAVGSTLGPKGRPVLIEDQEGHPYLTKDGVTVAKHLQLRDREENLGARLVAQAAAATVTSAGDGTTTSVVLANAICRAEEDIDVIKGIESASEDVVAHLEEKTRTMSDEMIRHIAYISTNNDDKLAKLIAEAFIETGEDGVVDVRMDMNSQETTLDIQSGSFIQAGYTHQHFITNIRQRTCEYSDPLVLVSNATLTEIAQIEHILGTPVRDNRPIVIIGDFDKNFTEAFTANVSKGTIKGCLIDPGAVGNDQLRDLAALLGAIYFDNANGNSFDYVSDNYWGSAKSIICGQGFTLFAIESNDHVQDRIDDLKEMIEESPEYAESYRGRLSMLNGKYATIKVGAPTQAEALEAKDRLEDAVFAVGAAQKGGYLPGGGVALRDASSTLERAGAKYALQTGFDRGYNFLLDAIKAPYITILENAGIDHTKVLDEGVGYDASSGEVKNMVDSGIIDPAIVTTQSLINATSASAALLSAKATLIIVE